MLLCSDGLSSYVPGGRIHDALAADADAGDTADRLVELALAAGGKDNVSVIVAAVTGSPGV
mgnify:CR=1 FL=1